MSSKINNAVKACNTMTRMRSKQFTIYYTLNSLLLSTRAVTDRTPPPRPYYKNAVMSQR